MDKSELLYKTPFSKKKEMKNVLKEVDNLSGYFLNTALLAKIVDVLTEKEVIELPKDVIDYLPSNKLCENNALRLTLNSMFDSDDPHITDWILSKKNQIKFAKAFSGEYEVVEEKETVYIIQIESKESEGLYSYLENYKYITVNQITKEVKSVWNIHKSTATIFKDKEEAECIAALIRLSKTENITVEKYRKWSRWADIAKTTRQQKYWDELLEFINDVPDWYTEDDEHPFVKHVQDLCRKAGNPIGREGYADHLEKIKERDKEILFFQKKEYSPKEIAETMNISLSAVHKVYYTKSDIRRPDSKKYRYQRRFKKGDLKWRFY